MKLSHHIPLRQLGRSDPVPPAYQAEVDASTAKAAVLFERAQRRLARAEARLLAAQTKTKAVSRSAAARRDTHEISVALELVELRREELRCLEAMMKHVPASVEHRGRKAYRPIPQPGDLV